MFEGARLKLERADHHIRDLETQLAAFIDSHPYTLGVANDAESGKQIVRVNFREAIPKEWALIVGDAINNLRSALDHMTWDLIGRDGGTQDRYVKFPAADSRASFAGLCNGMKTPSQSVKDILKALEVFPCGKGNTLHVLHQLDIADKHFILMPVIRKATISKFVISSADRTRRTVWADNSFVVAGDTGHINVTGVPPGGLVEFKNDTTVTPDIILGPINPEGGYIPIGPMLRTFHREVAKTINGVEAKLA